MRDIPSAFAAHLASGVTTVCWCWRLETRGGDVLGFTDHDRDLAFGDVTYEAASGFTGSEVQSSLGLSVDNLEVAGALASARIGEADLLAGRFDGAGIEIFAVNWQAPEERVLLRKGSLGEVTRGGAGFSAEMRGLAHRLGQPMGRLFRFGCDATLGDQRCGVDLEAPALRGSGAVVTAEENRRFRVSGLDAFADGWFGRGRLAWTAGLNAGRSGEVKAHRLLGDGVVIELWEATASPVSPGDGFVATAGCDKQFSTCRQKFANAVNFRGFPHMPGNDFVVAYPNTGDATHDGASRGNG
ncbi:MAG: DUF2163 domain-containing protein [Parvibaculaceae bacterium]